MDNIPDGTKAILLDIIGTTTPDSFVEDTLANYMIDNLHDFLWKFYLVPEVRGRLADLKRMHSEDGKAGRNPPQWDSLNPETSINSIVEYCSWLIMHGSNARPLRYLEDHVWELGYRSGELRGEVYPEVPEIMSEWKSSGLDICTYSTGTVLSQQLIFGTTKFGDLMPMIKGFFDTSVGLKSDPQSYRRIAGILRKKPGEILFFSASLEEVFAAKKAGMNVVLMVRNKQVLSGSDGITTLSDLKSFESIGDRKSD